MAAANGAMAGLSIYQSQSQARDMKLQGAYQERMANIQAQFSEDQAKDAIRRGDKAAATIQGQTRKLIGSQRAALAAQGIDINSGDAALIQEETNQQGDEDALTIRNNAWREAWGYRAESNRIRAEGEMANFGAKNAARNTILTGGMQALSYGSKNISTVNSGSSRKSWRGAEGSTISAGSAYSDNGRMDA